MADEMPEIEGGEQPEEVEKSPGELAGEFALSQFLAGLGADAGYRVNVYQEVEGDGDNARRLPKPAWLFESDPDSVSLEDIQRKHGGGQYRFYVTKKGKRGLVANEMVALKSLPKPAQETQPTQQNHSEYEHMRQMFDLQMGMMREQNQQMQQMMMGMLQNNSQNQAPQVDPTQMMATLIQSMVQMKELTGNEQKDPTDLLMKGIKLAKDLNANDSGGDSMAGVFKELISSGLGPIMEMSKASQQTAQNAPAQIPYNPAQAQPGNQMEQQQMILQRMIKKQLADLIDKAQRARDPSLYAEVVLDNVPDAGYNQFRAFIESETCLQQLTRMDQRVGEHYNWFDQLRTELIQLMREESGVDESGNGGDTPNNGPDSNSVHDYQPGANPDADANPPTGTPTR